MSFGRVALALLLLAGCSRAEPKAYDGGLPVERDASDGSSDAAAPLEVDCRNGPSCPRIELAGSLLAPGYARGRVDAVLGADPSGDLLMSYTFVSLQDTERDIGASIHFGRSTDGGRSFSLQSIAFPTEPTLNPSSGDPGYVGHEVSSFVHHDGALVSAHLRFFDPRGGGNDRRPDGFLLELRTAAGPEGLGDASPVRLAGNVADASWGIERRLSDLSPELSRCTLFLDPILYTNGDRLFLLASCVVYDGGTRRPEEGLYAVFDLRLDPIELDYLGAITDSHDARQLGAEQISKGRLTRSRDGTLLFLSAPVSDGTRFEEYSGCFVHEVESLDPPRLRRDPDGRLMPARMIVRSTDSVPTAGSCSYDPLSETGIVLTRRELRPESGTLEWSLHATFAHP